GKIVRSTVAHARIVSIDASQARALPGVRAVITAADLPRKRVGRSMSDYEVLCSERVRFIGDPVAAVAADTPEIADQAAQLVEVGRAEFWGLNKIPFALKNELAGTLDLPPEQILVHAVHMGGEFGAKASPGDAPAAYHLARASGRPLKFVNTYQEELVAGTPRHAATIRIKTGAK